MLFAEKIIPQSRHRWRVMSMIANRKNEVKQLSEMTLKELWALFPIFLVEHNDKWAKDYSEMAASLKKTISDCHIIRISHIGSTAISGIYAKDIVDILIETDDMEKTARVAAENGFIRMSDDSKRVTLCRGYTPSGFEDKVFHLHIRLRGDNDELYFRDYLNDYPDVAKQYESLKLTLWKKYEHNRDAYTNAKGEFVKKYTKIAKSLYGNRYR